MVSQDPTPGSAVFIFLINILDDRVQSLLIKFLNEMNLEGGAN